MTTGTESHDAHGHSRSSFQPEIERLRQHFQEVTQWCDRRDGSVVALIWDDERSTYYVASYRFEDGQFWEDDDEEDLEVDGTVRVYDDYDDALVRFNELCRAP